MGVETSMFLGSVIKVRIWLRRFLKYLRFTWIMWKLQIILHAVDSQEPNKVQSPGKSKWRRPTTINCKIWMHLLLELV